MPRIVPPGYKRDQPAKTSVRLVESRMLQDIADELGCCQADVVYLAVVKLLRERKPEEADVNKVGVSLLVG